MTPSVQPVPSGWERFSLGELLKFSNGINADKSAYGSGVPFANVLEVINNEWLELDDIPGRISLPRKVLARYEVRRGDILFNRTSETQDEVGLASVYLGHGPIVFGGFVFRGRPLTNHLDPDYSKYALRTAEVRDQITARGQGGIRANVSQRDLRDVTVTLPPVPEQRIIAEALDDASNNIKLLGRLIAKKQAIKQGMVQQLLTGHTRLAEFRERWVRLADVTVRIGSGITPRGGAAVYKTSGRPFIRSQNVGWGELRLAEIAYIDDATHITFPATEIRTGDVLLNITGASIGRSAVATVELRGGNVNQHVCEIRLKPGVMDPHFVNAVLTSEVGQSQIDAFQAGGNRQGLNFQQVGSIRIPAPDIEQQRAIGRVLTDADNRIAALQRYRDKTKAIKQGMMQQLLTGRTRLPVQETAA